MTAQRQEGNGLRAGTGFRRGIAFFACWQAFFAAASVPFAAPAATTERVVVNRFSGLAIEGFDPVAYFVDARPVLGLEDFEASEAGAVGASTTRATAPPLSPIPIFTVRSSAATTRSMWRAASPWPATRGSADLGTTALSVRPRAKPGRLRRRSRALPRGGHRALAGVGAVSGAFKRRSSWPGQVSAMTEMSIICRASAASGSPQAMNSGTIKLSRGLGVLAELNSAPCASVILPPAAVTTACPAATSHSLVGARRG